MPIPVNPFFRMIFEVTESLGLTQTMDSVIVTQEKAKETGGKKRLMPDATHYNRGQIKDFNYWTGNVGNTKT